MNKRLTSDNSFQKDNSAPPPPDARVNRLIAEHSCPSQYDEIGLCVIPQFSNRRLTVCRLPQRGSSQFDEYRNHPCTKLTPGKNFRARANLIPKSAHCTWVIPAGNSHWAETRCSARKLRGSCEPFFGDQCRSRLANTTAGTTPVYNFTLNSHNRDVSARETTTNSRLTKQERLAVWRRVEEQPTWPEPFSSRELIRAPRDTTWQQRRIVHFPENVACISWRSVICSSFAPSRWLFGFVSNWKRQALRLGTDKLHSAHWPAQTRNGCRIQSEKARRVWVGALRLMTWAPSVVSTETQSLRFTITQPISVQPNQRNSAVITRAQYACTVRTFKIWPGCLVSKSHWNNSGLKSMPRSTGTIPAYCPGVTTVFQPGTKMSKILKFKSLVSDELISSWLQTKSKCH